MRESLGGKNTQNSDKVEICGNLSARINITDSRYLDTLDPEDRKRFREKLKVPVAGVFVNIRNPYEMWNDKPTLWPDISFGDLWMYLVEKPGPFNSEKLKSYKSLEAYEYFISRNWPQSRMCF